jgi:hypothetical protein
LHAVLISRATACRDQVAPQGVIDLLRSLRIPVSGS